MSLAKAGIVTSVAPKAKPAGAVAATSVRTPGDASAPSRWRSWSPASGRQAREAGAMTRTSVPRITKPAATRSAAAGEATMTIAAVSSGPVTKTSSMAMPSSA